MEYVRWYDKDIHLHAIVSIFEKLPQEIQDEAAQDLLQIVLTQTSMTCDDKIVYLHQNAPPSYKRWYDKNINLHSAIELLKTCDEKQKKDICQAVLEFLYQISAEYGFSYNE